MFYLNFESVNYFTNYHRVKSRYAGWWLVPTPAVIGHSVIVRYTLDRPLGSTAHVHTINLACIFAHLYPFVWEEVKVPKLHPSGVRTQEFLFMRHRC